MAFAAVNSSTEPRSFSIGPVKVQLMQWTAVSGDTSGTITCDNLASLEHVVFGGGLLITAQPTISGNVATIAFTDPAANRAGTLICIGR